jgi:hypothetical protein
VDGDELLAVIRRLRVSQPLASEYEAQRPLGVAPTVSWATQKDHLIGSLSELKGPGYYGRLTYDMDHCGSLMRGDRTTGGLGRFDTIRSDRAAVLTVVGIWTERARQHPDTGEDCAQGRRPFSLAPNPPCRSSGGRDQHGRRDGCARQGSRWRPVVRTCLRIRQCAGAFASGNAQV